jgi:hypothetical protein
MTDFNGGWATFVVDAVRFGVEVERVARLEGPEMSESASSDKGGDTSWPFTVDDLPGPRRIFWGSVCTAERAVGWILRRDVRSDEWDGGAEHEWGGVDRTAMSSSSSSSSWVFCTTA